MKKIFFAVLALAAMASCSKEYTVDYNKQAIAFGEAFVDNGTRADYSQTDKPVEAFNVWGNLTGSYSNTVQIFNGAAVTKPTEPYYDDQTGAYSTVAWICNEVQYWVPSASYEFAAIVDCDYPTNVTLTSTGLPATIPFTVADGDANKDLLYAEATATTDENAAPSVNPVAFTFTHLLSKIQFTIANKMAAKYSIKVTGITVTGAREDGLYTIGTENSTWATTTEDTVPSLTFGTTDVIASANTAVASETRQILPVAQTLAVTIAYEIYFKDGSVDKLVASTTKSGNIPAQTYQKNTVYNIKAEIDATKIQFSVNAVGGFNASTGGDITVQ